MRSGPKDIVILMDSSGSMLDQPDEPRQSLMHTAVNYILDSLSLFDQVAIVEFNEYATQLCGKTSAGGCVSLKGPLPSNPAAVGGVHVTCSCGWGTRNLQLWGGA